MAVDTRFLSANFDTVESRFLEPPGETQICSRNWEFEKLKVASNYTELAKYCLIMRKGSCTAIVKGKAVNLGDGQGMQVPCTLDFNGTTKIYRSIITTASEKQLRA